jgi:hypothetical protein
MDKVELNSCNRIENALGAKQGVKTTCIRKVGKIEKGGDILMEWVRLSTFQYT